MCIINIGELEKAFLRCADPSGRPFIIPKHLTKPIFELLESIEPRLCLLAKSLMPFLYPGKGLLDRGPVDAALAKILDDTNWWKPYIPLLRFVRDEMDRLCPRRLENELPGVLNTCSAELNALAQFACINWMSYESCLRGDKDLVRTRELLRTEEEIAIFSRINIGATKPKYDLHDIEYFGKSTLQAKGGVCTTFGLTAAYILVEKACANKVRVELVAFRGGGIAHCFVVVNRINGNLDGKGRIPTPSRGNIESWGSHCYVVDPWAASLGSECISLWHEYVHGGFLFQLERTWCSLADEKPTCEVIIRAEITGKSCPMCKSKNLVEYSDVNIPSGFECKACGHKAKQSDFSEVGRGSKDLTCPQCKQSSSIVSIERGKRWKCGACKHTWDK